MREGNVFEALERELRIRNYSRRTAESYIFYNRDFIEFIHKDPRAVTTEDIKAYLDYQTRTKSAATISVAYNALLFYYKQVWHRNFFVNLSHPQKEKHIPVVLSKREVERMLAVTVNPKHNCIISLLYGTGVRVSELAHIKMCDVDLDRMVLRVFQGKGQKDRITILPTTLKEVLSRQQKVKTANDFLFTNGRMGGCLTAASIQKIVGQAAVKAGLKKVVSPHTLRHTFATHLLENGVDIRYIQELLGHAKLQTTQVYTKVAVNNLQKIASPLDV